MNDDTFIKAHMVKAALEYAHPMIRQTLLEDPEFRKEYGFKADAVLAFGDSGVSIKRSKLFSAIRKVFSGRSDIIVRDESDREWKIQISNEAESPVIFLARKDQRLTPPDFSVLSPDKTTRLLSLEKSSSDVNLPASDREKWHKILSERSLEDDEVDDFHKDFRYTPMQRARLISAEIIEGQSSISSLVPSSRKYYERLIGVYDDSTSIKDYATGCVSEFIEKLFEWRTYDGFLYSLMLSSHKYLTDAIFIDQIERDDLLRALTFIETKGDKISQLGAIEVGLRYISDRPEIEPFLIRLIEQIRDENIEKSDSGFALLSALFIFVDGELSRKRILSNTPPFYRRLASLSQAALIQRQMATPVGIDTKSFSEWALGNRTEQYYFQNLADMRIEPRWNPDLATASQIKADFFGRIMIAAENNKEKIDGGKIHKLIFGNEPNSIISRSEIPLPYLPGPLEGEEANQNILPAVMTEAVEKQLQADEVGPSSFTALLNSALVFRVEKHQAELAAKALKLGNHRLTNINDRMHLLVILTGLATVAAITREKTLADELRILSRRYRIDKAYRISIEESMRIGLVAAASRTDMGEWREFVGDWLTELSFSDLKSDEGELFYSHLQCLLHSVPELWVSCGRAEAAILAHNTSMNKG